MAYRRSALLLLVTLISLWVPVLSGKTNSRPNIVFLLSDDQDRRLGSMDFMSTLQREMVAKGVEFTNHYTTTAQCCPSRVTMMRGQQAHNTNITNVFAPGGNYEKFILSGEVDDYLPHWMKKAGYRTEYLGKFLNGVNILNWDIPPKGWDHIDYFLEPYQTTPNNVVMSNNGATPIAYLGYHQTDVIRAKALSRLQYLIDGEEPFFMWISPTAPHVDDDTQITVPCERHMDLFPNITAPRLPNYNPPDGIQGMKGGWLKDVPLMDEGNVTWTDLEYRRRAQALQGIDEMLGDILALLESQDALDNTYIVYASDNGYHLGNHRMTAGKATAYVEDTNLPFVVRGPGIPAGEKSSLPSSFIDLAPTLLDIAGLPKEDYPPFLDGRSLLAQWYNPQLTYPGKGQGAGVEVLNIEYWGPNNLVYPKTQQVYRNNTYKSLRIIGDEYAYFYQHWCYTNEIELYDTVADPYELKNLAVNPDNKTMRLLDRLNALLLVQKSCATKACLNPWTILLANSSLPKIDTLKEAMDPTYDAYFASFPRVNIAACLGYQDAAVEQPFYPPGAEALGSKFREPTDKLGPSYKFTPLVRGNERPMGTNEQRYVRIGEIESRSRELTSEELDRDQPKVVRSS